MRSYKKIYMTRDFKWFCIALVLCVSAAVGVAASDNAWAGGHENKESYSEFAHSLDSEVGAAIENRRRVDERLVSELLGRFLEWHDADAGLDGLSDGDAEVVLRSMLDVNLLVPGSVHPDLVPLALRVNESRSQTMTPESGSSSSLVVSPLGEAYQALVNARMFEAANDFSFRQGVEPAGWMLDLKQSTNNKEGSSRYLEFTVGGGEVEAAVREVDLDDGDWMVVEVHPDCGFSREAMAYISENGETMMGLPWERVILAVSQARTDALPSLLEWNRNHPSMEMVLVYADSEWPQGISFLEFPVFNLVRDGQVVDKVRGWPGDHQGDRIRASLQSLGFGQGASEHSEPEP